MLLHLIALCSSSCNGLEWFKRHIDFFDHSEGLLLSASLRHGLNTRTHRVSSTFRTLSTSTDRQNWCLGDVYYTLYPVRFRL